MAIKKRWRVYFGVSMWNDTTKQFDEVGITYSEHLFRGSAWMQANELAVMFEENGIAHRVGYERIA